MTTRRRFTADFKARVALEALRGDRTDQAVDGLGEVFSNGADRARPGHEAEVKELHAKACARA